MATTVDFVHAYTAVNNSGLVIPIFFQRVHYNVLEKYFNSQNVSF